MWDGEFNNTSAAMLQVSVQEVLTEIEIHMGVP